MSEKAVTKAVQALEARFPGVIIQAEKIPQSNRYSLLLISDHFKRIRPYRRQSIIWDLLDKALTAEEFLKISFVFPLLPSEVTEQPAPSRTRKKVVSIRQTLAKN